MTATKSSNKQQVWRENPQGKGRPLDDISVIHFLFRFSHKENHNTTLLFKLLSTLLQKYYRRIMNTV